MSQEHVEEQMPAVRMEQRPTEHGSHVVGYVISAFVDLFLLYVFNNLLYWGVPFITQEWADVLWAVNASQSANLVVHLLWVVYDAHWFKRLGELVMNGFGWVSVYTLLRVFPFDIPQPFELAFRIGLFVALFGIAIAMGVGLVRLLFQREA